MVDHVFNSRFFIDSAKYSAGDHESGTQADPAGFSVRKRLLTTSGFSEKINSSGYDKLPAILKRFTFAQKYACHKFIHVIRLPLEEWYLC